MTRELIDDFSQKEAQEIEAAAQRKKKKGKSVARGEESDDFPESDDTEDYDSVSFKAL